MRLKVIPIIIAIILLTVIVRPTMSLALQAGDQAPQFKGNSTQGKIELADIIGKKNVVLALYFAIFTPVWTNEVLAFQRDLEEFAKLDAQVIGVSRDSMQENQRFVDQNEIEFPLISDENKSIRKLYGRGRVTYLIDKNGVVQFIQKGVPDNQDFLNALKKLK